MNELTTIEEEYKQYSIQKNNVDMEKLTNDEDILNWWKNHKSMFPKLSQLAKIILAIPATSLTMDELFNPCRYTNTQKKTALGEMFLENLIFIHDNYDLIDI